MLKKVIVDKRKISIGFELKNYGKFRLKQKKDSEISSTYSAGIKKKDIKNVDYYLEWQISYYIDTEDAKEYPEELQIKTEIKLSRGKSIYPAELFGILNLALINEIIAKEEVEQLRNWICSVEKEEFLDDTLLKHDIKRRELIQVKDLIFETAVLELPYCILKNPDSTWIEIIVQKQQYAYSFQPMIYLCLPDISFTHKYDIAWWNITQENISSITNTLKVFALASKRHKKDVCNILKILY